MNRVYISYFDEFINNLYEDGIIHTKDKFFWHYLYNKCCDAIDYVYSGCGIEYSFIVNDYKFIVDKFKIVIEDVK